LLAGLKALFAKPAEITVSADGRIVTGQLVLIGNGRLYGGPFRIFPHADLRDGLLDLCVFPRANWWTLLRCGPPLLLLKKMPEAAVLRLRVEAFELSASSSTPFEIDGELAGRLPARICVRRQALRVLTP
jgi:diacylglycerol kinase family enzyme